MVGQMTGHFPDHLGCRKPIAFLPYADAAREAKPFPLSHQKVITGNDHKRPAFRRARFGPVTKAVEIDRFTVNDVDVGIRFRKLLFTSDKVWQGREKLFARLRPLASIGQHHHFHRLFPPLLSKFFILDRLPCSPLSPNDQSEAVRKLSRAGPGRLCIYDRWSATVRASNSG